MSPAFNNSPLSPEAVQTPVKGNAGHDDGNLAAKHLGGFEVKNTFIHYGSPLKTVSVVTPPKTVPSNFAPENLVFEKLMRTPLARAAHASTPSTAAGGHPTAGALSTLLGGMPPPCLPTTGMGTATLPEQQARQPQQQPSQQQLQPPPQKPSQQAPQPGAAASTVLRLSDFLASPTPAQGSASMPAGGSVAMGAMQQMPPMVGQAPVAGEPMQGGWFQGYSQAMNMMPPVPPLPGPAPFTPTAGNMAPGQPTFGACFEAAQPGCFQQQPLQPMQPQVPQGQDVVAMAAMAGATAMCGSGTTVCGGVAQPYDAAQFQPYLAGDGSQMMASATVVAAPAMAAPAMPPAPTQLPPQQDAGALPLSVSSGSMMPFQQQPYEAGTTPSVFELLQQEPPLQTIDQGYHQFGAPAAQPALGTCMSAEWQQMAAQQGADWSHMVQPGAVLGLEAMPPPPAALPAPGSRVSISVGHFPEPGTAPPTGEQPALAPQQPLTFPPQQPAPQPPQQASPQQPPQHAPASPDPLLKAKRAGSHNP